MIENIQMATKSELQKEMECLENDFNTKKNELSVKTEELLSVVRGIQDEMKKLSERYSILNSEIDKREGKKTK